MGRAREALTLATAIGERLPLLSSPRVQTALGILGLLLLATFGATLAPDGRGWRSRERRAPRLLASSVLVGLALAVAWPAISARRAIDLAPPVLGTAEIAGAWRYGGDTVTFLEDGSYRCDGVQCMGMGPAGRWQREGDHGLAVRWRDGHSVLWRIVRYHEQYRLALPPSADGASWDGRLFYQRALVAR